MTPKKAEVVSLNGTNIYYEIYGKGDPLILLHGYTQSSKYWLPFLPDYVDDFEVYLIDLQGHGKSGPFKEKLSVKSAASDVDALIKHLDLEQIKAIGFSFGGDVLFQLAFLQPRLIRSMITIGSSGSWNARDFPDWMDFLSYENIGNLNWMYEHQTNEAQIRSILDQFPNYSVSISDEEMESIQSKILFVLGDQDTSVSLESVSRAKNNLFDAYLWILPNTGHGPQEGKNKQEFVRRSKEFLKDQWKKGY
ncbi:MAG: alpha/beta hydrolase [Anditalea sp.]